MGISTAVVRAAANTTTGDQDFTASLGGLTPKGAVVFVTRAVTDATAADHALLAVGLYHNGTRDTDQSASYKSQDALASSSVGLDISTAADLFWSVPSSGTGDATGTVTFIANGIRINWTDAPDAAYLVTVWLFAGDDLSAHSDTPALPNSINGSTDITAVGFEPDVVILVGAGGTGISLGFVHNNRAGTVTQRCNWLRGRTGRATMEVYGGFETAYGANIALSSFAADGNCKIEANTFDSSGFTITERIAASGGGTRLTYLALRLGATPLVAGKVYTHSTPASSTPGSVTDTGPGFEPQFVTYVTAQHEAAATYYTDGRAGVLGATAITPAAQQQILMTEEDAAADSNTKSYSSDQAVDVLDHTGAASHTATYTAMTSSGVTLNWSLSQTTAKLWAALAIEAESAGGAFDLLLEDGAFVLTGQALALTAARALALDDGTFALTGNAVTLTVARVLTLDDGVFSLSGQAVTLTVARTLSLDDGAFSLTGNAVTLTYNRPLALDAGSYTLTGNDVTFSIARVLTLEDGTFTLLGQAVALTVARQITLEDGAFALTGFEASLIVSRALSLDDGAYTLTGNDLTLTIARILALDDGTFVLTGKDVTLTYTPAGEFSLALDDGTFILTGFAVGLTVTRVLALDDGAFILTGNDVLLLRAFPLAAETGVYALSGNAVLLAVARAITLEDGAYALAGNDLTLTYNRPLLLETGVYALSGQDVTFSIARLLTLIVGSFVLTGRATGLTYSGEVAAPKLDVTLSDSAVTSLALADVAVTALTLSDSPVTSVSILDVVRV